MNIYLAINEQKEGPFTVEHVNGLLAAGQVTPDTLGRVCKPLKKVLPDISEV